MITIHRMYSKSEDYTKEDKYYSKEKGSEVGIYNQEFFTKITGLSEGKIEEFGKENVLSAVFKSGLNTENTRMIGKDLTFSAPKSVSTLWALGSGEMQQAIEKAQKESVKSALDYASRELVTTRMTHNKETETQKGNGLAASLFSHYTSRTQDPQLHTHAIVFNATQRQDGKIRAIDWDSFGEAKNLHTLDSIYKHTLSSKLQEAGLKIEWDKEGKNFEIAGFSKEALEKLSEREQDIHKYAQAKGLDLQNSSDRKESILATRPEKNITSKEDLTEKAKDKLAQAEVLMETLNVVSKQEERFKFATESKEKGVSEKELVQDLRKMDGTNPQQVETTFDERRKEAVAETARTALSLQDGVFTKSDIIKESISWLHAQESRDSNYAYLNVSVKEVEDEINKMIQDENIQQVGENKGQEIYASKEFLNAEQKIIDAADKIKEFFMSKEQFKTFFSEYLKDFENEKGFKPSEEQQKAVEHIFTTNKQFIAIQGRAGTGKSAGILAASKGFADFINAKIDNVENELKQNNKVENFKEELKSKLEESGLPTQRFDAFYGVAPTGQAAKVLQHDTGMKSATIHSLLNTIEKYGDFTKDNKTVRFKGTDPTVDRQNWYTSGVKQEDRGMVFMDEAGMADARLMANIIDAATSGNRRMIFVGDTAQFQSVGAGRAFDLFQKHGEVSYVENIIRQKDPFLRDRAMEMAKGDILSAWKKMDESGKYIHDVENIEKAIDKATDKFLKDYTETKNTYVLVGTNKEKDTLNEKIREKLIEKGEIDKEKSINVEIIAKDTTQRIVSKGMRMTRGTQQKNEREFAKGDRIVFLKNDNLLEKKFGEQKENSTTKNVQENVKRTPIKNGEIGNIIDVDKENNLLKVEVNEKVITFNPNQYRNFDHAYAITGHKSQGATMDRVISVLDGKNGSVHNANSVYVHVTRTKNEFTAFVVEKDKLEEKIGNWQKNASAIEMKEEWDEKLKKEEQLEQNKTEVDMKKEKTLENEKTDNVEKKSELAKEAEKIEEKTAEMAKQSDSKSQEQDKEKSVTYDAGSIQIENVDEIQMAR